MAKYMTIDGQIVTRKELEESFARFPEEIRWEYCDCFEEYLCIGIALGSIREI